MHKFFVKRKLQNCPQNNTQLMIFFIYITALEFIEIFYILFLNTCNFFIKDMNVKL